MRSLPIRTSLPVCVPLPINRSITCHSFSIGDGEFAHWPASSPHRKSCTSRGTPVSKEPQLHCCCGSTLYLFQLPQSRAHTGGLEKPPSCVNSWALCIVCHQRWYDHFCRLTGHWHVRETQVGADHRPKEQLFHEKSWQSDTAAICCTDANPSCCSQWQRFLCFWDVS